MGGPGSGRKKGSGGGKKLTGYATYKKYRQTYASPTINKRATARHLAERASTGHLRIGIKGYRGPQK